jgi:hypothetical protein
MKSMVNEIIIDKQESIKHSHMKIWKEEGIIHCVYTDSAEAEMSIEVAEACVQKRIAFSEGISYPCLFDITHIKPVNKEVREYFATEGAKLIKAGAIITKSLFTKMLANIFLSINKPQIPIKLFSDEASAIKWLKKYVEA